MLPKDYSYPNRFVFRFSVRILKQLFYIIGAITIILSSFLPTISIRSAAPTRADAIVLVNSASSRYVDFQRLIRPYLDHFGVPYSILDVSTSPLPANIDSYALIIIGHRQLDASNAYLNSTEEAAISSAVSSGTGLMTFDNDLARADGTGRYRFIQDIFGFTYGAGVSGNGITISGPTLHYITERHTPGENIPTGTFSLPGINTVPSTVSTIATSAGQPFLATTNFTAGRAVMMGSYEWASLSNKGPVSGLDDLVWRSLVWAAHKPFVMQGMPPFLTMRVDDELGPFDYIRVANEFNIKPWAGLFVHLVSNAAAADLSGLVNAGNATTSIHHGWGTDGWFYWAQSDSQIAANFQAGTNWHTTHNIPISNFVVPHSYQIGTNAFSGLSNWGVKCLGTEVPAGQTYGSPWIMGGPYRLYETGFSGSSRPFYYADYMTIPGHPEFNRQFFNINTEIRDDAGYEWYPNADDVPGSIGRGTRQTKRALDSMALATLFTHANYIHRFTMNNWRATLQGITNNLASYQPINVTMDYACQYLISKYNSKITSSTYEPASRQLRTTLSGATEIPTKFYLFTEDSSGIRDMLVDVPQFTGSTDVVQTLAGPLAYIQVTPNPGTVAAGASLSFIAAGYDANNNPVPGLSFTWSVVNGGGTIDQTGRFTAGVTPNTYTNTVVASLGSISGSATVVVTESTIHHFEFDQITSPKYVGAPFSVTIRARDAANNLVAGFVGNVSLSASSGTVSPATAGPFSGGIWSGQVTLGTASPSVTLTAANGNISGTSNTFAVETAPTTPLPTATTVPGATATHTPTPGATNTPNCPCSIWDANVVPLNPYKWDGGAVELGVKFRSTTDGFITALRFFRGASNPGTTFVGHLWTANGSLLAEATFPSGTQAGWQQVSLSTPVPISASTTYVASYHTTSGYAADESYFTAANRLAYERPPLRALVNGEAGGNGVYRYGPSGSFPESSAGSNYWVDVVFSTTITGSNTPTPIATNTPTQTATNTPLPTATNTPTPTATNTPPPTATNTPLPAATNTPLSTATNTPPPTATNTPLPTATNTPLPTATNTPLPTTTPVQIIVGSIQPNWIRVGATISATITGSGFSQGAAVSFSSGQGPVPVGSNVVVVDSNTITLTITTSGGGPKRDRVWDVRVTNPNGSSGVLIDAFTVLQ